MLFIRVIVPSEDFLLWNVLMDNYEASCVKVLLGQKFIFALRCVLKECLQNINFISEFKP